ncbi:unnamed protein product [Cuscuta epithymum]|uniref:THO1-MOS11 C-terminal domain-containing protein n=1 Tax=Cuscuta epithymum TaxID=186058 RepID=A0AAV0CID4_9ASTE|nr:unnamed protein product [Cuscuta epithymum]
MTTTTAPNAEVDPKTLPQSPSQQPDSDASEVARTAIQPPSESKTAVTTTVVNNSSGEVDIQKKIKRAERFGVPVQLSEKEKRNSRAERFGTTSSNPGSDSSNKAEEVKRKARAERFGLEQVAPTDEEAKKKARLARFAPVAKVDPVEEDKKKARAMRFSQSESDAPSRTNGKGKPEGGTVSGEAGET